MALFDAATHARLADIPVQGRNPEHAVFSPDSRYLYVSAEEAEQVDVIDVAQRRQAGSVAVGLRPRGIGFAPDSSRVYVACEMANAVYVIDAHEVTESNISDAVDQKTLSIFNVRFHVLSGGDLFDVRTQRPRRNSAGH